MRPSKTLRVLQLDFEGRVRRLQSLEKLNKWSASAQDRRNLAYAVVELQTAWTNFVREFYLSCAAYRARTTSGYIVTHSDPSIMDERSALERAIQLLKTPGYTAPPPGIPIHPRHEPDWKQRASLLKLSVALGLSNTTQITAGLSVPSSFFDEFFLIRNFCAHRDRMGAERVRRLAALNYNAQLQSHPITMATELLPHRPVTLFWEWSNDVMDMASFICS